MIQILALYHEVLIYVISKVFFENEFWGTASLAVILEDSGALLARKGR